MTGISQNRRSLRREASNPQEISRVLASTRREFLRGAAGLAVGSTLLKSSWARAVAPRSKKKVVVVTFGGGARDQETFAPEGQENIPHLMRELIPQSTFFTQVVNHGILGHYVATASLATGVYETFNNFAAVPPPSPTVFEYFRKDLKRPASDAWVVAPSNGFNRIGESSHRSYGPGLGARVILPKRLLSAATAGRNDDYQRLLRDNYETPLFAPELAGSEFELQQLEMILKLSVDDFRKHAQTLSSPRRAFGIHCSPTDAAGCAQFVVDHDARHRYRPCGSIFALHRGDSAHRPTLLDLWKTIQSEPEYAGNTTLFILPDFGRDADEDAGGNGFQHHRTGDALSRTTWMLVAGPGVREGVVFDRAVDSTDLVPTLGSIMGFVPSLAQGKPIAELV